jgi:hypothetical protein
MARFIQLPSKKTLNLDAILWIDHPPHQRGLRVVFYGQGELLIKDEADKEMLLRALRRTTPGAGSAKSEEYSSDY